MGGSGLILTISRIRSVKVLLNSPWGRTLSVKILLYVIMVSSAMIVVFFVGPRLKRGKKAAVAPEDGSFDPVTLAAFDGREGRPALVAVKGAVYDVSPLKLWINGQHVKHGAGKELTNALSRAPHGLEKLEAARAVGAGPPLCESGLAGKSEGTENPGGDHRPRDGIFFGTRPVF